MSCIAHLAIAQSTFNNKYRFQDSLATIYGGITVIDTFFYTSGVTLSSTLPITNRGLITKFTLDGEKVWERRYGDSILTTEPGARNTLLIPTHDGNFALSGVNQNGISPFNSFLLKCDATTGDPIFYETFDSNLPNTNLISNGLVEYDDGSFLIASGEDFKDVVLIKTDQFGNEVWRRTYGNNENNETPTHLIKTTDNKVIVYTISINGVCDDPDYARRLWVFEIDNVGDITWEYWSSSEILLGANQAIETSDGGAVLCGIEVLREWHGPPVNYTCPSKAYICKIDDSQSLEWEQTMGYLGITSFSDAVELENGNIVAVGSNTLDFQPDSTQSIGWLVKFNQNGDVLWTRNFTKLFPWIGKWHRFFDIKPVNDGGFLISGTIEDSWLSSSTVGQWGWVIRTDSSGCVNPGCQISTSLDHFEETDEESEIKIFPNPATSGLKIDLPIASNPLTIIIYSVLGEKMLQKTFPVSQKQFEIDVSSWPSGQYFVALRDKVQMVSSGKFSVLH
ncbi:MAG: T9SS type A sorting domain-containing protein [Bacteroidota bacterium]